MIRPTPAAVLLYALGIPVAFLPALWRPDVEPAAQAWLAVVTLLCLVDLMRLPGRRRLSLRWDLPARLHVGRSSPLALTLDARRWHRPADVEVHVDVHPDIEPPEAATVRLEAASVAEATIPIRPRRRGLVDVHSVWLRWRGPWGLFAVVDRREVAAERPVLPDLPAIADMALAAFGSPRSPAGRRVERFVGAGSEFESLRSYVAGLDPRSIDWKATARHRRLMSRRYRAERNHRLVVAIDTGHLMAEDLDGIPRLDHAVNAGLLLADFALRSGDRVGLYAFDARPRLFLEPRGGRATFSRLQERSASLDYGLDETNYALGLLELRRRLRRRVLVVVFTEFVDTVTARLMMEHVQHLARRHVVLFVALRDPSLDEIIAARPDTADDVARAVVAEDFARERAVVLDHLRRAGVHVVDVPPGGLSVALVARYLRIRERELVA